METKQILDDIADRFFRAFVSRDIGPADLSELHELFIPQAVVIKTCGPDASVYSLQEFIEPRVKLLSDGSLTGFRESEISERTDVFGHIAQRFSGYQKSGSLHGVPFSQKGMKTMQFVRTSNGWKISSLAWDDEREGLTVSC